MAVDVTSAADIFARPAGQFASPIDAGRYGPYRAEGGRCDVARRLGVDVPAVPGRFHIYGARSCPRSHRLAIVRQLTGARSAVSMSFVDEFRDGRGWAFRESNGPDPVNGFTLLRQAYEATDPGYAGSVSVPILWDRAANRVSSVDATTIGIDIITAFGDRTRNLYDPLDRERVEEFGRWCDAAIARGIPRSVVGGGDATSELVGALRHLDGRLASSSFVLGERLTDADVRLWVLLVRYDTGPNAHGRAGPRLVTFASLWDWARALYAVPAFRETTEFASFSTPFADVADWNAPARRTALAHPGGENGIVAPAVPVSA